MHTRTCNQTHTQVCEALAGLSDPEEASLLRANVLEEVAGKELSLATDAASATLLEQVRCLLGGVEGAAFPQLLVLEGVEGAAAAGVEGC